MPGPPSKYNVLDVPRDASQTEIKRAYSRLLKKHHPDTAEPQDADEDKVILIVDAYRTLKDPAARREYDADLSAGASRQTRLSDEVEDVPPRPAPTPPFFGDRADAAPPSVSPFDDLKPEPLVPALAKLVGRLLLEGIRRISWLLQRSPRLVIVGALLVGGVIVSSFVLRQCQRVVDEVQLEAELPESIRDSCDNYLGRAEDLPPGGSAGAECHVAGISVSYFEFDEGEELMAHFDDRVGWARQKSSVIQGNEGACQEPGHTAPYRYSALGTGGKVLCYIEDERVHFEWTSDGIYAATSSPDPYGEVYRWWLQEAGPSGNGGNKRVAVKVR